MMSYMVYRKPDYQHLNSTGNMINTSIPNR